MMGLMERLRKIDVWKISTRCVVSFFRGGVPSYRCLEQDHAEEEDDDDDEEEEEEEESKIGASRGGRRHATGKSNDPVDQPLVRAMATGSAFSARTSDSRGPVVGQLISV